MAILYSTAVTCTKWLLTICVVYSVDISACVRDDGSGETSDGNTDSELLFEFAPPGTPPETLILALAATNSDVPDRVLQAHHLSTLVVKEDVVRSLAPAFVLMFTVTTPANSSTAEDTAQSSASAVGTSPVATQVAVDISSLLLGQTQVKHAWPSDQHVLPAALAATFEQLSITVTTRTHRPEDSEQVPPSELEETPLLPPGLSKKLSPIVLHFHRAISIPDQPATTTQLDADCYRCCFFF